MRKSGVSVALLALLVWGCDDQPWFPPGGGGAGGGGGVGGGLPGCDTPNPEGCRNDGCPDGQRCVVGDECVPSSCFCDAESGEWVCTEDCGGGVCMGEQPDPCALVRCAAGTVCEVIDGEAQCVPVDPCAAVLCREGTVCEVVDGQPQCVPVDPCARVRCGAGQECRVWEPTGEAYCADTCEGRMCPEGQVCELEQVVCVREPCPPIARCVPAPDACEGPNPAGCLNNGCPEGQVCVFDLAECTPSSCRCDPDTGFWACTRDCGGGVCRDEAPDPCALVRCAAGTVCEVIDGRPMCVPVDPCAGRECRPNQECHVWEPTGEAYCADTCEGVLCERGQHCELVEVQCVRAPCPPIAQCVPDADPCALVRCAEGTVCQVNDAGQAECVPERDPCDLVRCPAGTTCEVFDGQPLCVDSCDARDCPAGTHCELIEVQCLVAPCPPIAQCVPDADPCDRIDCRANQECRIWEPTGEAYCADDCDLTRCPDGQICELQRVECVREPCPPIAQCVPPRDPCDLVRCPAGTTCEVFEGQAFCADTCEGRECPRGTHCELVEVQCIVAPCPPIAQCLPNEDPCPGPNPAGCRQNGCPEGQACVVGDECVSSSCICTLDGWACTDDCGGGVCVDGGEPNRWYLTCGDPVCRGHIPRDDIPRCDTQELGALCRVPGAMCDPGNECNALYVCTDTDPRAGPCPISKAEFKKDIEYLDEKAVAEAAAQLQSIKLARWHYKAPQAGGEHLGFIIDDGVPAPALRASGDQVDLYGYTSLAVAALQAQAKQIAALQAEIEALKARAPRCE